MKTTLTDIDTRQIWADYKSELAAFIRARVKDNMEAEDILQETFIKVHLHLASLKDEKRLKAWIYRITRNVIQDYYRKQRSFVSADKMELPQEETPGSDSDFLACMLPFINKLPDKYKEAIVLSDLEQVGQNRLAEKLKISYSGAKSRVQRARKLLHAYFAGCCEIVSDKYGNIISHRPKGHCSCGTGTC